MQLTFLGAARTVTGSKFLVQSHGKSILVDCGLYQGHKDARQRNWANLTFDPTEIDAVILTHAHIDHSGYLPVLVKKGFTGRIYCTQGTKDLCAILLPDSGHLEEEDAARANKHGFTKHKPALPLYTREDAIHALHQFFAVEYDQLFKLNEHINFKLSPSGHIIGASFVRLESHGKTLVFSGDLGRPHHPIMKAPVKVQDADYLILESTYGDRLHEPEDPINQMADIINTTVDRGGSVVIPAFAVGRSQDVLYILYKLKVAKRIPDIPIFLDSPMAQDVSDLLGKYAGENKLSPEMCKNICGIARYTKTATESMQIDQYKTPIIIISASGMVTGGRILHHLKTYLPHEHSTVIFTGYQDPGTRGAKLLKGDKEIKIYGELVPVRAQIVQMENMSAHADYDEILAWLKNFSHPPKKVFLTHGGYESAMALQEKIEAQFGWTCVIPDYMDKEKL